MEENRSTYQLIWGILLILAGVGVFYRIPEVIPRVEQIKQFSAVIPVIRFCFYFLGGALILGGSRKVYRYFKAPENLS